MSAKRALPLSLLSALALAACAEHATLHVRSDTSWSGTVIHKSASGGPGDAMWGLTGDGPWCWTVAKTTREGWLETQVTVSGGFPLLGPDDGPVVRTTAGHGVVSDCWE